MRGAGRGKQAPLLCMDMCTEQREGKNSKSIVTYLLNKQKLAGVFFSSSSTNHTPYSPFTYQILQSSRNHHPFQKIVQRESNKAQCRRE